MKKLLYILVAMLTIGCVSSCDESDELSTYQYAEGVKLNAFGPSPVARGGQIRFVGSGLDQITSIVFPDGKSGIEVTEIDKVSDKQINVTVPKDDVIPGIVELKYAGGSLYTASDLTFSEPIEFTSYSPAKVKAGQILTIEGDYLNLMHAVVFAVGDTIYEKDFKEHTRYVIKVEVPATAQTGKIAISDAAEEPNVIESENALEVTLPAVAEIANLTGKKPSDKIELAGTDLDLVTKLTVADAETDFTVAEGKISFVLPTSTPDAAEIAVYPASGVKVTIATIGMTIPTEVVATPANELRNGTEIVLSGKDLDVVEKITFPSVTNAATFTYAKDTISVKCPEGFTSGDMVLTCKSGIEIKVAIVTQKPAYESFTEAEVSMGNDVTINGQNLDLVAKVVYAGGLEGTVKTGGTATQIVVTMPASGVETGKVTLVMANGETAETGELTVNAPVFAYAAAPEAFISTDEKEIKAGDLITTSIMNGEHLTKIEIDGTETQYILQGETIYILTTDRAGFKSKIKFISDNGEIEYDLYVIPNTSQKKVVWSGMTEITWNDGGRVFVPGTAFDEVPEGAILHLCFTQKDQTWAQAQVNNGWWQNSDISKFTTPEGTEIANPIVPTDIFGWFSDGELNRDVQIVLTADLLNHFRTHVGDDGSAIIIQGQDLIFTQVYITWEISLEVDVKDFSAFEPGTPLSYPFNISWSDAATGKVRIYRQGLKDAKVKLGSTMYIYKEGTGQCQINNPNWGAITTAADWTGDTNPIEVVFNEDMMKCVSGEISDGWGDTAFILQGDGLKITKITVLP